MQELSASPASPDFQVEVKSLKVVDSLYSHLIRSYRDLYHLSCRLHSAVSCGERRGQELPRYILRYGRLFPLKARSMFGLTYRLPRACTELSAVVFTEVCTHSPEGRGEVRDCLAIH